MLNEAQRKVVEHRGSPLLVVAGAGSGKTTTLAHRIESLLTEIPPESVLCLTFTSKASREIRERTLGVAGVDLPWAGTFHSVALKLLKSGAGLRFSVADESDVRILLREVMENFGLSANEYEKVRRMISRIKEDLREPADPRLRELFHAYQEKLRENNLFDFGDLL